MSAVIYISKQRDKWWLEKLKSLLPNIDWYLLLENEAKHDVEYAIVWNPPIGSLSQFPNLKLIVSVGVGVDHILKDPSIPSGIPIVKTVNKETLQKMKEYIALHVLRIHRNLKYLGNLQSNIKWGDTIVPTASNIRVGFMGVGNMALPSIKLLQTIGYKTSGWSTTYKEVPNLRSFAGKSDLPIFLKECEIIICMLPLTSSTRKIFNKKLFLNMQKSSHFINVGRGELVVDEDLIDILNQNHLSSATLDVYHQEPLPHSHPFWTNKKVLMTFHTASLIDPEIGSKTIAENILKFVNGDMDLPFANREAGY